MSTWLYLTCLDHEPPLFAVDESGQHLTDLPRIRSEIAQREAVVKKWAEHGFPIVEVYLPEQAEPYFERHSALFLSKHPKCHIGITDEYGREHSVTGPNDLPIPRATRP